MNDSHYLHNLVLIIEAGRRIKFYESPIVRELEIAADAFPRLTEETAI
jgi:hypothetical protein